MSHVYDIIESVIVSNQLLSLHSSCSHTRHNFSPLFPIVCAMTLLASVHVYFHLLFFLLFFLSDPFVDSFLFVSVRRQTILADHEKMKKNWVIQKKMYVLCFHINPNT